MEVRPLAPGFRRGVKPYPSSWPPMRLFSSDSRARSSGWNPTNSIAELGHTASPQDGTTPCGLAVRNLPRPNGKQTPCHPPARASTPDLQTMVSGPSLRAARMP